jgi:hypothetical protein
MLARKKSFKCRKSFSTKPPIINVFRGLYEYENTPKLVSSLHSIDENKRGVLQSWKATNPTNLLQFLRIRFTQSSNALEGNSVTLEDMIQLIERGLTIGMIPLF